MRAAAVLIATALCLVTACADAQPDVPVWSVQVIATHRHDPAAFTEGLEVHVGTHYESTGLVGQSGVRATDWATGRALAAATLPAPLFGEGIAVTGDTLWQLTWRDGVAIARDRHTLTETRRVRYDGEGWGLCERRGRLVMSDGSNTLTFRDPTTFAETGAVTLRGWRGTHLNELDCAPDGFVYANAFPTDDILRINPETGTVTARINATALRTPTHPAADVLNGIAHLPTPGHFLLTGKNWPTEFIVTFKEVG